VDEKASCDRQWVAEDKSWTDFYPEREHALYKVTVPTSASRSHPLYSA